MAETFDFAVSGINHNHIYDQVDAMRQAGCRLVKFFAPENDLAEGFAKIYPQAERVFAERQIMDDPSILLVVGAGIPCERTPMALRAMAAGKDVMLDKPGCTSFEQLNELRQACEDTGQICSIFYAEHYGQKSTVQAIELVRAGSIGKVISTTGLGPHRLGLNPRPDWFWDPKRNGSTLVDIASHQFEQFLSITGALTARILHSVEANYANSKSSEFSDYGHAVVEADGVTGFIRVDWFTPDGSPAWGDGRLLITGTEGTIELRKYMDIEGRSGENHLFLTDKFGTQYIDCNNIDLTFGSRLRDDVLNRTETAMTQKHCFQAMDLALQAHAQCRRIEAQFSNE